MTCTINRYHFQTSINILATKFNEILLNNQNAIQVKAIRAPCCSISAYKEQNGIPALCFAWLAQSIMQHCTRQQNSFFRFSRKTLDALYANSTLRWRYMDDTYTYILVYVFFHLQNNLNAEEYNLYADSLCLSL